MEGVRVRPSVRRGTWAVGTVVLLLLVCTQLVAAQDGAAAGRCTGLAPGASWICRGVFAVIEWVVRNIQALVQGLFEAAVEFIVTTPAPYADGQRALLKRPDNGPWPALYHLYLAQILPIALGVWAVVVLLVQFTRLFTATVGDEYRRTRLTRRATFAVLFIIAWWPAGAFALHLADALTLTLAPSGAQMLATVADFRANVGGGLLVAGLAYLSAGVVAVLLVALFLARYVVIFSFMPLMPIVIALGVIDEGPFKPIAGIAKSIGNLFVPFVFMTLPTAAILLVGYTIQDALETTLADVSVLATTQPGATSAYAVILFVFWVLALLAPIFVLLGSRGVYPLAFLGAGFVAGRSLSVARPRLGTGTTVGGGAGAGAATGAKDAAATATDGTVGTVSAGGGATRALTEGTTGGVPAVSERGGVDGLGSGGTDPDGFTPGEASGTEPGGSLSEPVASRVDSWTELEQQLSENRRYEFGYSSDGTFQPVSPSPPNATKESILHGRIREMTDLSHFEEAPDMYIRDDHGEYYDLTPLYEEVQKDLRIERHGRQTVREAQQYASARGEPASQSEGDPE